MCANVIGVTYWDGDWSQGIFMRISFRRLKRGNGRYSFVISTDENSPSICSLTLAVC